MWLTADAQFVLKVLEEFEVRALSRTGHASSSTISWENHFYIDVAERAKLKLLPQCWKHAVPLSKTSLHAQH